jgi:hypothetical protein
MPEEPLNRYRRVPAGIRLAIQNARARSGIVRRAAEADPSRAILLASAESLDELACAVECMAEMIWGKPSEDERRKIAAATLAEGRLPGIPLCHVHRVPPRGDSE